jgi:Arc/MetJ-type ribon-helix-helix transcriptional regulator
MCIAFRYTLCMTQFVTRIDEFLASDVDLLVAEGVVDSRSDAVRRGLRSLIDAHQRSATADAIVRGYNDTPQSIQEVSWSDEATRQMIADEPW